MPSFKSAAGCLDSSLNLKAIEFRGQTVRVFLLSIEFSRVREALEPSRKKIRELRSNSRKFSRDLLEIFKKLWKIFDSRTEEHGLREEKDGHHCHHRRILY